MNLILVDPQDLTIGTEDVKIWLDRNNKNKLRILKHIEDILRAQPEDKLKVGIYNGNRGYAKLLRGVDGEYYLSIVDEPTMCVHAIADKWKRHPYECGHEALPFIDVALATPRPKTFDKTLQYLSAMSVGRVTFFASSRSELAYFSSRKLREEGIKHSLRLGLEQSCKTVAPKVSVCASWMTAFRFLENDYSDYKSLDCPLLTLIAHPYKVEDLEPKPVLDTLIGGQYASVLLLFGPEGGFLSTELKQIVKDMQTLGNVTLVQIGEGILRCEAAAISLVAQCSLIMQFPHQTDLSSEDKESLLRRRAKELMSTPDIRITIPGKLNGDNTYRALPIKT